MTTVFTTLSGFGMVRLDYAGAADVKQQTRMLRPSLSMEGWCLSTLDPLAPGDPVPAAGWPS
jgi:hypothetical protein